ncbi:MAG: hypothetical protein ABIF04_06185 [Chloroflexota bacterium]
MKQRLQYTPLIALNILVIVLFIVQYANSTYPIVGHDYRLFVPRLIDTHLFYKINGLGIEWYTPNFGGGLPAYPNPLQMQFSLTQLIAWFFNPWVAILASAAVYIAVGFLVTFLLLRDVLEFKPFPAILGASFFVANGFVIERVVVGHADKITFPLIAIPIFALLNPKLPRWLAGSIIALTGTILLYSGGVYIAVMCFFTVLVSLPLIYFLRPSLFTWRKMFPVVIWGGVLTLLLCGSKFYAITALMQSFPRTVHDQYFVSWYSSVTGLVTQLLGVMSTLPFLKLIGKNSLVYVVRLTQLTGSPYGFWDLETSISPILSLLLILGFGKVLFHRPRFDSKVLIKRIIAGICLAFAVILVFEFATARGGLFNLVSGLPIFRSLRTNTRFTASFILPLAILGAKVFDSWSKKQSGIKTVSAFALMNCISLAALWLYYLLPIDIQGRNFEVQGILNTYTQIQNGETFPVNKIIPDMNDYEVFQAQASNVTHHYDPLFGENSFQPLVHEGSVFDTENGYYNITDPTGYVFPSQNNSELFSRIPVSDYDKLVDFINHRRVYWKLPPLQIALDWTAGLTIILIICAVSFYLASKRIPFLRSFRFPPFPRIKRS